MPYTSARIVELRDAAVESVSTMQRPPIQAVGLTASEVMARMGHGERFVFVDTRSSSEWSATDAKLPGAIHVPEDEVAQHLKELPLGHPVVSYCSSPDEQASTRVAEKLMRHGFLNAQPLIGGFEAWRRAGYPVEPK
ncbi:MAG: rhodanese-like domain-containing protein [Terriglobia bacterium]